MRRSQDMTMLTAKDLRTIKLPGGRRVGYVETGDPSGRPVFMFHGLPGGCLGVPAVPAATGARVVVPGRPGYGYSDPLPRRRIADWSRDIAFMASALGIYRFALVGSQWAAHTPWRAAAQCLRGPVR